MITLLVHDRLLLLSSRLNRLEVVNAGRLLRNASEHGKGVRRPGALLWLNWLGNEGTSHVVHLLKLYPVVVHSLPLTRRAEWGGSRAVLMDVYWVVVATRASMHMHVELVVAIVVGWSNHLLMEKVGVLRVLHLWVVVFLLLFFLKSTFAPIKNNVNKNDESSKW